MESVVLLLAITGARCLQAGMAAGLLVRVVLQRIGERRISSKATMRIRATCLAAWLLLGAAGLILQFVNHPLVGFLGRVATFSWVVLGTGGFGASLGWRLSSNVLRNLGLRRRATWIALGCSALFLVGAFGLTIWRPMALLVPLSFYALVANFAFLASHRPKSHVGLIVASGLLDYLALVQDKSWGPVLTLFTVALLVVTVVWIMSVRAQRHDECIGSQ